jgi:hypothetical protein
MLGRGVVFAPPTDALLLGERLSFESPRPERFRGRVVLRPERPMGRRDVARLVAAFYVPWVAEDDTLRL